MFKIARIAKQICNAARNVSETSLASINSMVKYCSQSKGYVEDAADEFYFESFKEILPKQSVTKDQFKATAPIFQETNKLGFIGSYKILDSAETRKLIYARFADEIAAKSKNDEEKKNLDTKNQETKGHATKEHLEACNTYNITEEFKMFKEQGYDFAATREVLQNQNQDTNQSPKSIFERMKELSISGYLSNYAGYPQLREDIEKVILQKDLVINDFMERVNEKVGFVSVNNSELLVNTINDESFTDVTMTDLLGEY